MHFSLHTFTASLLLILPATVHAIFKDEVGHVDYHHELLGVPHRETTFFHRPRPEDKASLLYTLSDLGVLGAVNPSSGAVVWRQLLNGNISHAKGHLRAGEDETWLASALGNSIQAWDAITGRNIWSTEFDGVLKDLEIMEMTEQGTKDVLVLHEEAGKTVARRLGGADGHVVWQFTEVTSDLPLQVSTNVGKVFVVTLHGSLLSYTLKVVILDPLTGKKVDEVILATKGDVQKEEDVMFVGANSATPIVAWTDHNLNKLRVNVLGQKNKQEFPIIADAVSVEIHAPHNVQSQPHFLVHTRTTTGSKAEVYHIDLKTKAVTKAYELPLIQGGGAFSTSSHGANVYFTRITGDEILLVSSVSHGVLGRWPLKTTAKQALTMHGVSEVVKKDESTYAVRSAFVTDEDDWTLVLNGEETWSRPEGLSGAVAAAWAEIPESEDLARTLAAEAHSNPLSAYIHRVSRHISDLQYLPAFLQSIPARLISSILGTETTQVSDSLSRDSFGFNKLVVLATSRGKIYGLDVGNKGKIVWSKAAHETPSSIPWDVKSIYAEDSKGQVTVRGADGEYIIIKTDTGETVETMAPGTWPAIQSAVVVDSASGKWLLPVGLDGKIGAIPTIWAPKQTVVVRKDNGEIQGVTFEPKETESVEVPVWSFSPPSGQTIVHIAARPQHDPIASIGRVLGDRSVKYKYLNPNTIVVAAINEAASTLSVYLLDTVSGQILASSTYDGVDAHKPISCAIAENWFVCSFFGQYTLRDAEAQHLKGFQLVVSDLYESELSNDRGPLESFSNFSSLDPVDFPTGPVLPAVVSKTFITSGPIENLAVTETRQGITTRQVLAYLPENHGIIGIPRPALEPRRPVGRDPTPAEVEEGLTKYSPAIDLDPKYIITHQLDVIGVQKIITTPAILESTSLVFAYGIDIFGTRVTPSLAFDILGKGFNKLTLIATVLALMVGVMVLGPIVRRKQINTRWQAPM